MHSDHYIPILMAFVTVEWHTQNEQMVLEKNMLILETKTNLSNERLRNQFLGGFYNCRNKCLVLGIPSKAKQPPN